MKLPDIYRYKKEKENWKNNGQPVRSDERVAELYDICFTCENYIPVPLLKDRGQCKVCTCLLSKDADKMNKLRWATTRCPLNIAEHGQEPKWIEEPEYQQKEAEPEVPVQPQFNQRKKKGGGCGCG